MNLPRTLVIAALFLAPAISKAGLFSSKKKEAPVAPASTQAQRRYVLNVPDKNTEKELLDLLNGRQRATTQIATLRGLVSEKRNEYRALQAELEKSFGVKDGVKYYYDKPAKTIFELVAASTSAPPAEAATTNEPALPPGVDKKFLRQLREEKDADRFIQLVRAKDMVVDQAKAFQQVIREKDAQLNRLNERLGAKFSLSKAGVYNYDPKTMILYEMVQPAGAVKPGQTAPPKKNRASQSPVDAPVGR